MLFFIHGNDTDNLISKGRNLVNVLRKKRPDAEVFTMHGGDWDAGRFEEFIESQGLFEQKFIISLRGVWENKEAKGQVIERLKDLQSSQNAFVFIEAELDKTSLTKIEKVAEKIQVVSKIEKKKEVFNLFSLAEALGQRKKGDLWALYQTAKTLAASEEIHGILWWQVKAIVLASQLKNAQDAGLSPFVYQKASQYSKNFKESELVNIADDLVMIYHDAHRGRNEFEVALERFILNRI